MLKCYWSGTFEWKNRSFLWEPENLFPKVRPFILNNILSLWSVQEGEYKNLFEGNWLKKLFRIYIDIFVKNIAVNYLALDIREIKYEHNEYNTVLWEVISLTLVQSFVYLIRSKTFRTMIQNGERLLARIF